MRLAGFLAAGALIGWFYGHLLLGVLLVALASLGWHLYNLYRLDDWLRGGQLEGVPDGAGVWPPVFAHIEYMREKSRRRQRRWRDLLRELRVSAGAFPDGGVLLNARHEIVTFNAAAERLLSLKKSRDRGQRIENLLRHPDFVAYLAAGDFSSSLELPAPVGGDTWISCLLIPYGPDQRLLLAHDITDAVRMERMRRDFVANASHELRTPLTVITGYLDILAEDDCVPADWHMPLTEMRSQAARMTQLLDRLLELSRLETTAAGSLECAVDVGELLEEARREAHVGAVQPRMVEVDVASEARIRGDPLELRSVVSNLLSNALRYTPPEGTVRISWHVDETGGHLVVADTGIGIAQEDIPRLTERFYRTDQGRARQKGGSGLGLAIVNHCLRRHEAMLAIRSHPGEGSTFSCHFPPHRLVLS